MIIVWRHARYRSAPQMTVGTGQYAKVAIFTALAQVVAAFRRAHRAGAFHTPYTGPTNKNPNSPSGNF